MLSYLDVEFFVLIVVALVLYHFMPEKHRWIALGAGNLAFIFLSNEQGMVVLTLVMFAFTYLFGLLIEKMRGEKRTADYLSIGILVLITITFFVKYERIWIGTYNLFSKFTNVQSLQYIDLLAPFGITYFVLVFISYLCDVYWGMVQVEKNPFKLITVLLFFPLLTSGPIIKYKEVSNRFFIGRDITYENLCFGAQRAIWGVFKKNVISERLGIIVDTIYAKPDVYNGFYVLIAVWFFVLQLYTDFSGCIDIMLGISQMFGIELPENFDNPFCSKTIAEFWRRWHITLGVFLKDYIFYPLLRSSIWQKMGNKAKQLFGKKASKKLTTWSALLITWFLIGVWHGGGWNYIFGVGLFMGMIIILSEALEPQFVIWKKALHISDKSTAWLLFQRVRTFLLFSFGLSFFRASSISDGIGLWKALFTEFNPEIFVDGSLLKLGLSSKNMIVFVISLVIMFVVYGLRIKKQKSIRELIAEKNIIIRWVLYIALIWIVLVFGNYGPGYDANEFIYERF